MAVSFTNEETARLAHRLAEVTGTSVDEAVADAVRTRLAAVDDEAVRAERRREATRVALAEIHAELRGLPTLDARSPEEMLYDEYGLPK